MRSRFRGDPGMSIGPIEPLAGFAPLTPPVLAAPGSRGTDAVTAADGAAGGDFATLLTKGLENLEGLQDRSDQLAVQAATGDLNAIHDYTITATETAVATQLTTAVRNKALESFLEIMRMPV
jgi:flagellar hook-basal body complex protein FliE